MKHLFLSVDVPWSRRAHQCVSYADCRELVSQALQRCEQLAVLTADEQWTWMQTNTDIFGNPVLPPLAKHRRFPSVWTSTRASKRKRIRADLLCVQCSSCGLNNGDDFASCDVCGRWEHLLCANVTAKTLREQDWRCQQCPAAEPVPRPTRRRKGELPVVRGTLVNRGAVVQATFEQLVIHFRLEMRHWPAIPHSHQLAALTSPLTASELEGAIGVLKNLRHSGPQTTEPILRGILLGHKNPGEPFTLTVAAHSSFMLSTARWLLGQFGSKKRKAERGQRQLLGRIEESSSSSSSSESSLSDSD